MTELVVLDKIPFTQYLLPNGRRQAVTVERPSHIMEKAGTILQAGYRFECEILTTGAVSLTICDDREGIDVACVVCANGPAIPGAVDRLVLNFVIPEKEARR